MLEPERIRCVQLVEAHPREPDAPQLATAIVAQQATTTTCGSGYEGDVMRRGFVSAGLSALLVMLAACAPAPNPAPPQPPPAIATTEVVAGDSHTCALLADQSVTCWGWNKRGQLGNTTNNLTDTPNPTPTAVAGVNGATQLAAGKHHTCALLADQGVTCWGGNRFGQLGNVTNNLTDNANPTPTAVAGLTGVTQLAAGENHTCALLSDQTVTCWGRNFYGQLGNTTNNSTGEPNPTPTPVAGLTGVTQLAVDGGHSCALLVDQTVTCWGWNHLGQLGNTTNTGTNNVEPNPTPTPVAGVSGVTELEAGTRSVCAVLADQGVTCWGLNLYGELGDPAGGADPTPSAVTGLAGVERISVGQNNTCALMADRSVSCLGVNFAGQMGSSTNAGSYDPNPTPTGVTGLAGVAGLSVGSNHGCAVLSLSVLCWGSNRYGQLGNPANIGTWDPNPTPLLTHIA